jgi:hypothetical protein
MSIETYSGRAEYACVDVTTRNPMTQTTTENIAAQHINYFVVDTG